MTTLDTTFAVFRASIRAKLFAAQFALALVAAALASVGWWSMQRMSAAVQSVYDDGVIPLHGLRVISDMYAANIVGLTHQIQAGSASWTAAEEQIHAAQTTIRERWDAYLATRLAAQEQRLAAIAVERMGGAETAVRRLLDIVGRRSHAELDRFVASDLHPAIDPALAALGDLFALRLRIAQSEWSHAQATERFTLGTLLVFLSIGLAAAVGAMFLSQRTSSSFDRLTRAMRMLAGGDTNIEVPGRGRRDEIGQMAEALELFRANMKETARPRAEQAARQEAEPAALENRTAAAGNFAAEVGKTAQVLSAQAAELQASANSLSVIAEEANRQLTEVASASERTWTNVQTAATAAERLTVLIDEIGAKIAEMQEATGSNVTAIGEIGKVIGEIEQIASTIAGAVAEQGATTREIARNVRQAASGIMQVSSGITMVSRAAGEAGGEALQMLSAADELSQRSEALRAEVDKFRAQFKMA